MANPWINDDGLVVRFGEVEAENRNIGAYRTNGPRRFVEVLVDSSKLPAVADDSVILNDQFAIPAGAFIESVEIVTYDDFVGSGATFNLGVIDQDRTTGADVDGLVEAASIAELNAGGTNVAGWVGAVVGTELATAKLLTWEVDTAAITAGHATIRVRWSVPYNPDDTLVWNKS